MITDQVALVVKHPETLQDAPHPTIYHELLREDGRHKIPSMASLRDEAFLLVAAGTDTVINAATVGAINIIANKAIYDRLQAELRELLPNLEEHPRYEVLENIPYLVGMLTFRLLCLVPNDLHSIVSRDQRIVASKSRCRFPNDPHSAQERRNIVRGVYSWRCRSLYLSACS